jgi:hypothetical protein
MRRRPAPVRGPRPVRPIERRRPGRPPGEDLVLLAPERVAISAPEEARAVAALAELLAARLAVRGTGVLSEAVDDGDPAEAPGA